METRPTEGGLQSVDRLVRLLDAVAAGPATLSELAGQAGLSEATALRYLTSLVGHGMLERDPRTRHYRVAMRMFVLGRAALGGRDFLSVAGDAMTRLVDLLGETANLGARAGNELVIVHAVESRQPIRKGAAIGERDFWHSSGLGKAILATLPPGEVRDLCERAPFTPFTRRTVTGVEDLLRELERVRERGHAVDDEESAEGLRCVAAPVRDRSGTARYALSVSGPSARVGSDRLVEIGHAIRKEADVLEAFLDFDPTRTEGTRG